MRILAICYYAPPALTPQAIQIGRQLYHLDADVTLLHGRDDDFPDGFDQYPDFFERIESLCVPGPGTVPQDLRHRLARRLVPLYGAIPDGLRPWRRRARRAALAAIERERPDALVSFGMPMTDHLVGLDLARATGLPWVAHFSDPWVDFSLHERSRAALGVNARLERRVIEGADQVLFTSARTLELVMGKYPDAWRARTDVLPHAWDTANLDLPPSTAARERGLVVRHIGAFYRTRSPEPLFAALALLHERDAAVLEGVRFELVGPLSAWFLDSPAYRSLPPGLVTLRGTVPYRESLRLMRSADALLVVDAPSAEPSVFLPSKLVEYIGARRPVWGISPPGTSADLIVEWEGRDDSCADPTDVDGVARMLRTGLEELRTPTSEPQREAREQVAQRFSPDHVAAGLREHVQRAIDRVDGSGS